MLMLEQGVPNGLCGLGSEWERTDPCEGFRDSPLMPDEAVVLQAIFTNRGDDLAQQFAERLSQGAHCVVVGTGEECLVEVPHQMDKTLLLWAGDCVVCRIEIRDEHAMKVLEEISDEFAFPAR